MALSSIQLIIELDKRILKKMASIMYCKAENENYQESYIKEEVIISDTIESSDDEMLCVSINSLRTNQDLFEKLDECENNLIHVEQICNQDDTNFDKEIDVVNVDKKNEKLFEEHKNIDVLENSKSNYIERNNFDNNSTMIDQCSIKMEVDVTLNEEYLLLHHSDKTNTQKDTNKENVTTNKKKHLKSQKQTTIFNFLTTLPRPLISITKYTPLAPVDKDASKSTPETFENKEGFLPDTFNTIILICLKCARKEEILSRYPRTTCHDCKEPMSYECLSCSVQMSTIPAVHYHIKKNCRRQQETYQCEQCSYQGKNAYHLRRHVTSKHSAGVECPRCGMKFKTKWKVLRHEQGCGINVSYLRCKFCRYNTKYKHNILTHMRNAHKNIKPLQLAGIVKKIIEDGEKLKANALKSDNGAEVNMLTIRIDYKKFIQLHCTKCNKICDNVDYTKKRDCSRCGAVMLLQCIKCAKRYPKMSSMYMHLKLKCAAQNSFQCADCDYTTTCKRALSVHIGRRHTIVAPEDYEKCSKCDKKYRYRHDRIYHEMHCGREPVLQCKLCSFKSKCKPSFKRHMQDHILHPSIDNETNPVSANKAPIIKELKVMELTKAFCPKCEKSVKNEKHSKRQCEKCGTKQTYPCNKCDKIYLLFRELRRHVIHNHLSSELKRRQQCSACGERFTLYEDLRLHQNCCVKKPDLQCVHCTFSTKYPTSLDRHQRVKHCKAKRAVRSKVADAPKRFVCTKCAKGYISDTGLRMHKQYYCGKKRSLACDHCSYKSYMKNALIVHLKAAHNRLFTDQELKCRHCGKERYNVYTHNSHVAVCVFK